LIIYNYNQKINDSSDFTFPLYSHSLLFSSFCFYFILKSKQLKMVIILAGNPHLIFYYNSIFRLDYRIINYFGCTDNAGNCNDGPIFKLKGKYLNILVSPIIWNPKWSSSYGKWTGYNDKNKHFECNEAIWTCWMNDYFIHIIGCYQIKTIKFLSLIHHWVFSRLHNCSVHDKHITYLSYRITHLIINFYGYFKLFICLNLLHLISLTFASVDKCIL